MYIEDKTQEQKILGLLLNANGEWVALPKIIKLGISQYNARLFGLRKKGYLIENKIRFVKKNGKVVKFSFYKLCNNETRNI